MPIALIYSPVTRGNRMALGLASVLVIIGGIAQIYVIIIGGQAYPMEMFPGMDIISGYGGIASYIPSIAEIFLGVGGIAVALITIVFFVKFLPFLPESLSDEVADPHHNR